MALSGSPRCTAIAPRAPAPASASAAQRRVLSKRFTVPAPMGRALAMLASRAESYATHGRASIDLFAADYSWIQHYFLDQHLWGAARGHAAILIFIDRGEDASQLIDRKSTRLNSSHLVISYAVFCLKKKK